MLKGYNLAFMPINYSKKFVQFAHDTAKGVKVGDYLLGPISLPHVSICHFIMDDVDIENIWHQVQTLKLPTLSLGFSKIRAKIYPPDAYCNVTQSAVSLIPNNTDILTTTHLKILEIIHNPLNASFSNYDPHLTLFNSYDIDGCKHFNHAPIIQPFLNDDFLIALGHIDLIGQVTDILFMS